MSRNGYLLAGSLALCAAAAASILVIQALDKGGWFRPGRLLSGYLALLASPLAGVAAAAVWWRRHRWLPAAVLAVAAACLGLTLWGNLTDYREWSRTPPGGEVMHLGAFLVMLWCWALCLGLAVIGAVAWRVGAAAHLVYWRRA